VDPARKRGNRKLVCSGYGRKLSFGACALAQKACHDVYSALYTRAPSLFRDLAMAAPMARLGHDAIVGIRAPRLLGSARIATKCAPLF
jgi:hypothetical protein